MAALGGGIAAFVLGLIGIIIWWPAFLTMLTGCIPIMLLLGGSLAVYLGLEELKDKKTAEPLEDPKEDLKEEVETLKKELDEIKKNKETDSNEEKES
jgi:hypothetical protein